MKQEFVTLPREAVERAIAALKSDKGMAIAFYLEISELRAALEHPQNHVPDAENMAPAGWKLVPVEPTDEMVEAGDHEIEKWGVDASSSGAFRAMLSAAPQPPTTKESSAVQPQANQPAMTPIAQRKLDSMLAEGYTISGYSVYHERKHQHGFVTGAGLVGWWKPDGVEYPQPQVGQEPVGEAAFMPGTTGFTMACFLASDVPVGTKLYTQPQPKREPLTRERIKAIQNELSDTVGCSYETMARAIEAAHNIK